MQRWYTDDNKYLVLLFSESGVNRIEEYYIKLYTNFRSNETKKQKGAE